MLTKISLAKKANIYSKKQSRKNVLIAYKQILKSIEERAENGHFAYYKSFTPSDSFFRTMVVAFKLFKIKHKDLSVTIDFVFDKNYKHKGIFFCDFVSFRVEWGSDSFL